MNTSVLCSILGKATTVLGPREKARRQSQLLYIDLKKLCRGTACELKNVSIKKLTNLKYQIGYSVESDIAI